MRHTGRDYTMLVVSLLLMSVGALLVLCAIARAR